MSDATPGAAGGGEPYQSLYRQYRPQRFADVLGQEHVTRALRNAVRDGRVAHAYLFSGPRGTGKTSTARILAMALNCAHSEDGEPDGVCDSCVAIRSGASVDVHELDAASNRRLDEMRDLLSRVALGTSGRQKVYIIDEVHQLTADASSALLKTLEEPPAHVVFVLATTDPQRVLPTIRSRTQHYEFRLLSSETLSGLLSDVNERAGLAVPAEALDLVVRRGRGSARDALSVLDQVAAAGAVEDEATAVADIVDGIAERDAGRVLLGVAEALGAGRDPRRLAVDLIEQLRNGFLASQSRSLVLLADAAAEVAEAQAHRLGLPTLVRAIEELGRAAVDMRESVDPRVTLEAALVRLASPAADTSAAALAARVERLEAALADGATTSAATPAAPPHLPPTGALPQPALQAADQPAPGPAAAPPPRPGPTAPGGASRGPQRSTPPGPPPPSPGGRGTIGAVRSQRSRPEPPSASAPRPSPTPAPAGASSEAPLPSRDELTQAWGDRIVGRLPGSIKPYFSNGRFVAVEGGRATFALPDQGLLSRAQQRVGEAEAALQEAFGRRVPLHLVLDDGAVPPPAGPPPAEPPAAEDEPEDYDFANLEDAGPAVVSPEQRLLQAFPGAEEVDS